MARSPNLEIPVSQTEMNVHGRIPASIAARLRDAIISGEISPGSLLRQEELSKLFQVGRPPVREALTLLEAEGLVISRLRRGFAVAPLDPKDVEEIFDVRMLLEERTAYFAAKRRTAADIAEMEKILISMEQFQINDFKDAEAFALANRDFHQLIHRVSGRAVTSSVLLGLRSKLERYIRLGGLIAGDSEQVNREHRAIFEAFKEGNGAKMSKLLREHIREAGQRLISAIESKMPDSELS